MGRATVSPVGAPVLGTNTTLFRLIGANFNSTADQALQKAMPFSRYIITSIVVTNSSGNLTGAIGGFYTGAGKTGSALVSAAQTYAAVSTSTKVGNPTLTTAGQELRSDPDLFLSLTTALGVAGTADIYVMGLAG